MTDCNKTVKDIEYAKDLLQNRPEQDTVDYKVYEVLDDALDLIHDLRNQIAMLVAAQHELCELLKEQEADKNKYEYKYDHTDCLWYGSGNCPSTCSQYRDGWNDAMDYIFKDGKGYQPYRKSVE